MLSTHTEHTHMHIHIAKLRVKDSLSWPNTRGGNCMGIHPFRAVVKIQGTGGQFPLCWP